MDELAAEGIRPVLLKGASTLRRVYVKDPRPVSDIDLLVAERLLTSARDVLRTGGFELVAPALRDDLPQVCETWFRTSDGTNLDLHWSLTGLSADPNQVWTALEPHITTMTVRGRPTEVLDEPAWALHVALHAAQHGPVLPQPLEDLRRAISYCDDSTWSEAARLAGELGGSQAMSAGLRLVTEGAERADSLRLPLPTDRSVVLRSAGVPNEALFLSWWSGIPLRRKVWVLAKKFFPSSGYIRSTSRLARRGRAGLVLAYALRPFQLIARGVRSLPELSRNRRA